MPEEKVWVFWMPQEGSFFYNGGGSLRVLSVRRNHSDSGMHLRRMQSGGTGHEKLRTVNWLGPLSHLVSFPDFEKLSLSQSFLSPCEFWG